MEQAGVGAEDAPDASAIVWVRQKHPTLTKIIKNLQTTWGISQENDGMTKFEMPADHST